MPYVHTVGTRTEWLRTAAHLVLIYAAVTLAFIVGVPAGRRAGVYGLHLINDPASTQGFHPFVGALSYLAVFGWGITVAATLFAAYVLGRGAGRRQGVLWGAAATSLVLMLDDLFSLHEMYSQRWWDGREEIFFAAYGVMALALVVLARREVLPHRPWVLVLGGAVFAASILLDLVSEYQYLEEGLKTLGIATWAYYWASLAKKLILEEVISDDHLVGLEIGGASDGGSSRTPSG